ncbi:uncharacterized protein EKO05_0005978 [Ascochyta rabiei]|uniref:GTPase n=1 Tax=Didymella rabiei TaxID=5454 RepID=A0A163M8F1_DIDRA|nr:uncharacterized protein EKO05_0005978 [Ascochyta rabiei]KZM28490.1 GTPase [Ascochyta rabiei]UPX15534.1 hypothetical protein EKO05_0005978 [Ascochyta rabiei]
MSGCQSDSLFVPEVSPRPEYAAASMWLERQLMTPRERDVSAVLSPQAFEADHCHDHATTIGAEEVHDPAQEPAPDHPYFRLDVPALHTEIDTVLRDFWIKLQGFQDDDAEMANQREVIQQGRGIGAPKPLVVTTVGPAGVGKSFLYKALFNRPDITKSSAEGRSCTLYPTRIVLHPDAPGDTTSSDLDIEFFDTAAITTMTENHIRRYHEYHFGTDNNQEDDDSRRHALTAKEFFDAAFNTAGNAESTVYLQSLLTVEMTGSGDLHRACVDAIEQRISSAGATQNRKLSYLKVEDNDLDQVRSAADSLAPFVDFFIIKTGAAVLRAGLTFVDLPGLRDINQDRIARANAIRRDVDVELIICDRPERGLEDSDLDALIRQSIRAHGFNNTILVYNKIDTIFLSGVQDANDRIRESTAEPYTTIRTFKAEAEIIQDASVKRLYFAYLQEQALNAMIRERANSLRDNIAAKYAALDPESPNDIAVFAISAAQYLEWLDPSRLRTPVMSVSDTRVPALKRHLLSLTSARNHEHLWHHIHLVMAEIADSGTRVLEKFEDEYGYSAFCEQLAKEQIPTLYADLKQLANTQLLPSLRIWPYQPDAERQLELVKNVITEWQQTVNGPVLVASFNKALRDHGFIANSRARALQGLRVNWNQTLQERMEPAVETFTQNTYSRCASGWKQMSSRINDCMNDVFAALENSADQTPFKASFHREWRKLEHAIFTTSGSFEFQLHRVVRATHRFATTEEDVGCLLASLMAPIYRKVATKTGIGKYSRQVAALDRYLVTGGWHGGTIVDRYEEAVVADVERRLRPVVHWFLNEIKAELLNFVRVMEELLVDEQQLSVGQRESRRRLREALPVYEERLRRLQDAVPRPDR